MCRDGEGAQRVAEELSGFELASAVGTTLADLALIVYADDLPGRQDLELDAGLPVVQIWPNEPEFLADGPPPCTRTACAGPRAGVAAPMNIPDTCTMGLPVITGTDEDWTTAGHCDAQHYNGIPATHAGVRLTLGGTSYPSHFNFTGHSANSLFGLFEQTGWYSGSRMDASEIGADDHLVSNTIAMNAGVPPRRLAGGVAHGSVYVNDNICISGRISGFVCSPVTNSSQTVNMTGGVTLNNTIRSQYVGIGGDSGAPVMLQYAPDIAVGMYSGGTSAGITTSVSYFGDVRSGMQLYTTTDRRGDWVRALFQYGLRRLPAAGGYSTWRSQLNTCNIANAQAVATGIFLGGEFSTNFPLNTLNARRIRVELLFWTLMGRASGAGLDGYANSFTNESGWSSVVWAFLNSPEFAMRVNGGGANAYDGQIC